MRSRTIFSKPLTNQSQRQFFAKTHPNIFGIQWRENIAKWVQLQAHWEEFEALRTKTGESTDDVFLKTMAIVNQMRIHGDKMQYVTVVEKNLRSLTAKTNYIFFWPETEKLYQALIKIEYIWKIQIAGSGIHHKH